MSDTTPARRPSSTPAARRPSSTPAAKREARSEELRRLLHVVSPTSDVELTARKRCEEEGIDDIRQLRQLYDRGISLSDKLPLGVALELSHLFEEERADDDLDCVHVSSSADALAAVGANGAVISGLLLVLNVATIGGAGAAEWTAYAEHDDADIASREFDLAWVNALACAASALSLLCGAWLHLAVASSNADLGRKSEKALVVRRLAPALLLLQAAFVCAVLLSCAGVLQLYMLRHPTHAQNLEYAALAAVGLVGAVGLYFVATLAWLRGGLRRQRLGAVRYATRLKQGGGGGGGWQLADLCGGRSRKKAESAKINSYVRRRSQELDETASMAC